MTVLLPVGGCVGGVASRLVKLAARELLRMKSARPWDLAVVLGARQEDVDDLWKRLHRAGCIEDVNGWWRPTDAMLTLANARLGKPLARAKADQLVQQMVKQAEQLNADPGDALFYVVKIAVFGSYMDTSKEELGDLDVAWQLLERPGCERTISSMMCVNQDPVAHMRGRVRPRHAAVRLVDWHTMKSLETPSRVVMEMTGPVLEEALEYAARRREKRQKEARALQQSMDNMLAEMAKRREEAAPQPKVRRRAKR